MHSFSGKVGGRRSLRVPAPLGPLHPYIANVLLRNCSLSISARYFQDLKRYLLAFS